MSDRLVVVVGAGTMGSGIACVCLLAGRPVRLVDTDPIALTRAAGRIARQVERLGGAAVAGRLQTGVALDTSGADIVIEAIVESLAAKRETLAALDRQRGPETVLASNTSSLSIGALAEGLAHPERVVGLHFFNPAPVMRLVEIARGPLTSDVTVTRVVALAEELGKTPVVVMDRPGFVANRVLMPLLNEAMHALMEGVAAAEDIDTVVTLGLNHPMGPLRLADLIGLDVCLTIMETLQRDLDDERFRPCPLLREMVATGRLGRKTGQGFFTYPTT